MLCMYVYESIIACIIVFLSVCMHVINLELSDESPPTSRLRWISPAMWIRICENSFAQTWEKSSPSRRLWRRRSSCCCCQEIPMMTGTSCWRFEQVHTYTIAYIVHTVTYICTYMHAFAHNNTTKIIHIDMTISSVRNVHTHSSLCCSLYRR